MSNIGLGFVTFVFHLIAEIFYTAPSFTQYTAAGGFFFSRFLHWFLLKERGIITVNELRVIEKLYSNCGLKLHANIFAP